MTLTKYRSRHTRRLKGGVYYDTEAAELLAWFDDDFEYIDHADRNWGGLYRDDAGRYFLHYKPKGLAHKITPFTEAEARAWCKARGKDVDCPETA